MAIDTRERSAIEPDSNGHGHQNGNGHDAANSTGVVRPPNYLGRSIRVVGPQESPDPHDDPHAKNRRGELGKTVQNYYFNRFLKDPLNRMGHNVANNDAKAVLGAVISRGSKGKANPERVSVDPVAMTKHIKKIGKLFGFADVGIAPTLPEFVYKGGARRTEDEHMITAQTGETPESIAQKYPYAVCFYWAWDDGMVRAHRSFISDANYHFNGLKADVAQNNFAGYVRELGFSAVQGAINAMPMMLAAGLGELGRNGMIITEKHGSRHHPRVFLTDMPLVVDKPVDFGVSDFCGICKKCAVACPTNSISHDEKKVINGVEKFAINWKTCYSIRPHVTNHWLNCFTCIAVCPWTKPNVWWRTATVLALKYTPIPLRPLLIKPLIKIDNMGWGELPRKRIKWLGYDTARGGEDLGCTVGGCSCHEGEQLPDVGQYYPLKENARRFHKN